MYCFSTECDGITIMQLGGDLDARSASELRHVLGWALTSEARVVVDLADVGAVDTVAVGILLAAHRRAELARAELVYATRDDRVADALYNTVPPGQLRTVATVAEALACMSPVGNGRHARAAA